MERLPGDSAKKKIADALRHGRTGEAVLVADKIIPQNADVQLLILSAMAYFSADRFIEADELIRRAKRMDDSYSGVQEFEAFIQLKSASSRDAAAVAYLSLADSSPSFRYRRILKKIRTAADFSAYQKDVKLKDFVKPGKPHTQDNRKIHFPPIPAAVKKIALALPFVVAAAAIGAGLYKGFPVRSGEDAAVISKDPTFPDTVVIDSRYPLIDKVNNEKKKYFYIDEEQVKKEFNTAKVLLKDRKYNEARIVINRILASNANISVKERTEFLITFIPDPSTIPPLDVPAKDLFTDKELYDGVVIVCYGTAANVEKKDGNTMLTLLVNYQQKTRFDGIIEVFYNRDSPVDNGQHVTIHGFLVRSAAPAGKPYMQAVKVITEKK